MKIAKILKSAFAVAIVLALCLSMIPAAFAATCPLTKVDAPADGAVYKVAMEQNNASVNKVFYFDGTIDGKYLQTTENVADAADVHVKAVSGGYNLYVLDGANKKYIDIVGAGGYRANLQLVDTPTNVWTWDSGLDTFVATVTEGTFYMGTYSTYTTFAATSTYYTEGDKASDIGVSQFIGYLYTDGSNDNTESTGAATTGTSATTGTGSPDQSGDSTTLVPMIVVMALAVTALAALVIGKKRMF